VTSSSGGREAHERSLMDAAMKQVVSASGVVLRERSA
jgi:hypothetical protein